MNAHMSKCMNVRLAALPAQRNMACAICPGMLLHSTCAQHRLCDTLSCVVTCSPAKKMFRFKTGDADTPTAGARVDSPYSLSPVGRDSLLGSPLLSPKRTPRRIQRSPFKARLAVRALMLGGLQMGCRMLRASHCHLAARPQYQG